MAYALMTYFDYDVDKFITMYSKYEYGDAHSGVTAEFNVTRDQFKEYFNADLEAGRPIIMGGEDSSSGGHEFVCCGRDTQNRFYINFGWEGSGNGYYPITALKPSGYNFSSNLDAIIGLRPRNSQAIEKVEAPTTASKVLENGRVVIIRDNEKYTIFGQKIQ